MERVSLVDGVTGQILLMRTEMEVKEVLQDLPQRSVWEMEVGKHGKQLAPSAKLRAGKLYLLRPSSSLKRFLCEQGLWGTSSPSSHMSSLHKEGLRSLTTHTSLPPLVHPHNMYRITQTIVAHNA